MTTNLQHVVPQSWRWERQSRVMWTGSHIRGPQASWYKDKGKERQKSKEGRQKAVAGYANSWYSPAKCSPNQQQACLDSNQQVRSQSVLHWDPSCWPNTAKTSHAKSPEPWHQGKGRRNSPLLPPNEKLLLHKDHILQGNPDQQGGGCDIGNGGGHDQPVGRAAVTGGLRRGFDLCYDDGEPLHDDEEWHAQACKLQHLAHGKLQRPPRAHVVAVHKKEKEGRETGAVVAVRRPLSLWGLVRPRTSALSASTSIFYTPQPWLSAHPTAYTAVGIVYLGVTVMWLALYSLYIQDTNIGCLTLHPEGYVCTTGISVGRCSLENGTSVFLRLKSHFINLLDIIDHRYYEQLKHSYVFYSALPFSKSKKEVDMITPTVKATSKH